MSNDRGEFRGIYTALIDSQEFQDLSADARLVLFVLKLSLGKSGIAVLYPGILPDRTGLPMERVSDALDELHESGWLRSEKNVFWLRNGLRFEPGEPISSPNGRKGIENHLRAFPKLPMVAEFARYYALEPPFADPPETPTEGASAAPSKPLRGSSTPPTAARMTDDGRTFLTSFGRRTRRRAGDLAGRRGRGVGCKGIFTRYSLG
jgi:hypothetical protein